MEIDGDFTGVYEFEFPGIDLNDGDKVLLETRSGSIEGSVKVTKRIADGVVVVPTNHPDLDPRIIFNGTDSGTDGKLTKRAG